MYGSGQALNSVGAASSPQSREKPSMRERFMRVCAVLDQAHDVVSSLEGQIFGTEQPPSATANTPGPRPVEAELQHLDGAAEALLKRLAAISSQL